MSAARDDASLRLRLGEGDLRRSLLLGEGQGMTAAAYLRISQDRAGEQAGIQRQQEDCVELAARLGFGDPRLFIDNDVSAFDGGRRPGYEALETAQVQAGVSHIVLWHVDRLYRRPRELEELIDLVEQHPVRIDAVRGGGFDLNANEGRLMARQLVASRGRSRWVIATRQRACVGSRAEARPRSVRRWRSG